MTPNWLRQEFEVAKSNGTSAAMVIQMFGRSAGVQDPNEFHRILPNTPVPGDFLPTPGQYFYVDLVPRFYSDFQAYMTTLKSQANPSNFNIVSLCFHGTSVYNAIQVLNRGLVVGLSYSKNTKGIYVEGPHRTIHTLFYATHEFVGIAGNNAGWMSAVIFECLINPDSVTNVNGQWCCTDPRYLMITGMYVHMTHYNDLNQKGHRGTYRISRI